MLEKILVEKDDEEKSEVERACLVRGTKDISKMKLAAVIEKPNEGVDLEEKERVAVVMGP